ncbi:hypothetical protein NFI96_021140 [Prochilodus magdalenae]|nr:hypothetical protein NFI96_021140 [Prochilodus magdalenae]
MFIMMVMMILIMVIMILMIMVIMLMTLVIINVCPRCEPVCLERAEEGSPCVLTLLCKPDSGAVIRSVDVVSEARTIEVYSLSGDYCGTCRGERDQRWHSGSSAEDKYVFYRSHLVLDTPVASCEVKDPHRTPTGPAVLHQWAQDAAHRTLPTGRCPQDAATQDAATQDAATQDAAHRTLPTGRCPTGRCPTGRCPLDGAHWTVPTGRCPQDAAHRTLPHRTLPHTGGRWSGEFSLVDDSQSSSDSVVSDPLTPAPPTLTHHHHVSVTAVLRMIHHPHHTCSVVVLWGSCSLKNRVIQYTEKQMDYSLYLYTYRVSYTLSGADGVDKGWSYTEVVLMLWLIRLLSLGGRSAVAVAQVAVGLRFLQTAQCPLSTSPGIDLQQVQAMMEQMGTTLSPGAQNLMDMVQFQQKNKADVLGGFLPLLMGGGALACLAKGSPFSPGAAAVGETVPGGSGSPASQNPESETCLPPSPSNQSGVPDAVSALLAAQAGQRSPVSPDLLPVLQSVCGQVTQLRLDAVNSPEKRRNGERDDHLCCGGLEKALERVVEKRMEELEKRLKEHMDLRLDALQKSLELALQQALVHSPNSQ